MPQSSCLGLYSSSVYSISNTLDSSKLDLRPTAVKLSQRISNPTANPVDGCILCNLFNLKMTPFLYNLRNFWLLDKGSSMGSFFPIEFDLSSHALVRNSVEYPPKNIESLHKSSGYTSNRCCKVPRSNYSFYRLTILSLCSNAQIRNQKLCVYLLYMDPD